MDFLGGGSQSFSRRQRRCFRMPRVQEIHDRQSGQSAPTLKEKGIHDAKPGLDGGSVLRARIHGNSNESNGSKAGWHNGNQMKDGARRSGREQA